MTATWNISLGEAQRIIGAILEVAAADPERPVAAAVMDKHGDLVAFARMDSAAPVVVQIAMDKAYTAARLGIDTLTLAERDKMMGRELANYGDDRLTGIAGGVCVKAIPPSVSAQPAAEIAVGAIGVSGRRPDEDLQLAKTGLAAFQAVAPSQKTPSGEPKE